MLSLQPSVNNQLFKTLVHERYIVFSKKNEQAFKAFWKKVMVKAGIFGYNIATPFHSQNQWNMQHKLTSSCFTFNITTITYFKAFIHSRYRVIHYLYGLHIYFNVLIIKYYRREGFVHPWTITCIAVEFQNLWLLSSLQTVLCFQSLPGWHSSPACRASVL